MVNSKTNESSRSRNKSLSLPLLFGLSVGAGLSVASIYYSQPILELLGDEFHLSVNQAGLITTLTQIGYALGILFLVPLGDSVERKKLILIKSFLLAAVLLLCTVSSSYHVLLIVSLAIGVLATTAQDIIPATATLAEPTQRGKTVGTVMTGLLTGILLSRAFSGVVGDIWGWKTVFWLASLAMLCIGLYLTLILPKINPVSPLSYKQTMSTLIPLWKKHTKLKQASFTQCFLYVSFSAFWTTLAVFLSEHYKLGSSYAGILSFAGLAGAVAAPVSGKISDVIGPKKVISTSIIIVILSFVTMFFTQSFSRDLQLPILTICVITFDFGLNGTLIAHQSVIYGLQPEAKARLNSIFFTFNFTGMALGSAIGTYLYSQFNWIGVITLTIVSSLLAFISAMFRTDINLSESFAEKTIE
ncbi:MFS transporter [Vibrio aestuarianus]|uniref:MFS transporter n=1 Tax=Vibrio aestuarianus TaxID=28171 RepID=UPI00237CCAAC|nr:MFS transporter [Vibrio aestuarianus]MDE1330423.1 MFS transporter [Vibrio aestuarianus]